MVQDAPAEWREKIVHVRIVIGDTDLLGGDGLPGSYESPRGFAILLNVDDPSRQNACLTPSRKTEPFALPFRKLSGPTVLAACHRSVWHPLGHQL